MNDVELSLVPLEARPYQGRTAGIVTRLVAHTIDGVLVGAALIGTYLGVVAFLFVVSPAPSRGSNRRRSVRRRLLRDHRRLPDGRLVDQRPHGR